MRIERARRRALSRLGGANDARVDGGAAADGLVKHAKELGPPQQAIEHFLVRVGIELEAEAYRSEADWRLLRDCERTAEIEIALRPHGTRADRNLERRRDGLEGDARAG